MNSQHCTNLNHRRSNAPVRGCPMCGEVVNSAVRTKNCSDDEHARRRRSGDLYCTGCCERLRK